MVGEGVKAMVLAAGLGSRLRPLTDNLPKPCVPFLNEPLLFRCLRSLASLGHGEVVVNTSYQQEVLREMCDNLPPDLPRVILSPEEDRLGTGGGISKASRYFASDSPVIVMNGDVVTGMDLEALVQRHRSSGAWATLAVFRNSAFPDSLHKVAFDSCGEVISIDGVLSSANNNVEAGRAIYTGTLVMSAEFIKALPRGRESCLKEEGFWPALKDGKRMEVYETSAYWSDIGTPLRYLETHRECLENGTCRPEGEYIEREPGVWVHREAQVSPMAILAGPVVIGPDCVIEAEAHLADGVILGRGIYVAEGTHLSNTVLWDGTECPPTGVQNAIVHDGGILPLGLTD